MRGGWTKRDLGHRGTAARVLIGMAAVGTVLAFAPSIVLSIPRAPSWRWRRTRALRHSTRRRMSLLLSPRTRLESTSFSRPQFLIQTGSAPEFQARASSSFGDVLLAAHTLVVIPSAVSTNSWNLIFVAAVAVRAYVQRSQERRARFSPPSTPACSPLISTSTPSATILSGAGKSTIIHALRTSPRNSARDD